MKTSPRARARADRCPNAAKPVGRPFQRAGEFENRQCRLEFEFAGQDFGRHRAFRRVGFVLDVDQSPDRRQRILGVDAMALGHVRRSGDAGRSGLRAGNRRRAQFGQRFEQIRRDLSPARAKRRTPPAQARRWHPRLDSTKRSMLRSASKRAISLRASMAIRSAFSSMRRARSANAARRTVGWPAGRR